MSSHIVALLLPEYCSEPGIEVEKDDLVEELTSASNTLKILTTSPVAPTSLCVSDAPLADIVVPAPPVFLHGKNIAVVAPGDPSVTLSSFPKWHHVGNELCAVTQSMIDVEHAYLTKRLETEGQWPGSHISKNVSKKNKKSGKRRRLSAQKPVDTNVQSDSRSEEEHKQLDARYMRAAELLHHLMNTLANGVNSVNALRAVDVVWIGSPTVFLPTHGDGSMALTCALQRMRSYCNVYVQFFSTRSSHRSTPAGLKQQWTSVIDAVDVGTAAHPTLHALHSVWHGSFLVRAHAHTSPPQSPLHSVGAGLPSTDVAIPGLVLLHRPAHQGYQPMEGESAKFWWQPTSKNPRGSTPHGPATNIRAPDAFRIVHTCALATIPDVLRSGQVFELGSVGTRGSQSPDHDGRTARFLQWFPNTSGHDNRSKGQQRSPGTTDAAAGASAHNAMVLCAALDARGTDARAMHPSEYTWMRSVVQQHAAGKRSPPEPATTPLDQVLDTNVLLLVYRVDDVVCAEILRSPPQLSGLVRHMLVGARCHQGHDDGGGIPEAPAPDVGFLTGLPCHQNIQSLAEEEASLHTHIAAHVQRTDPTGDAAACFLVEPENSCTSESHQFNLTPAEQNPTGETSAILRGHRSFLSAHRQLSEQDRRPEVSSPDETGDDVAARGVGTDPFAFEPSTTAGTVSKPTVAYKRKSRGLQRGRRGRSAERRGVHGVTHIPVAEAGPAAVGATPTRSSVPPANAHAITTLYARAKVAAAKLLDPGTHSAVSSSGPLVSGLALESRASGGASGGAMGVSTDGTMTLFSDDGANSDAALLHTGSAALLAALATTAAYRSLPAPADAPPPAASAPRSQQASGSMSDVPDGPDKAPVAGTQSTADRVLQGSRTQRSSGDVARPIAAVPYQTLLAQVRRHTRVNFSESTSAGRSPATSASSLRGSIGMVRYSSFDSVHSTTSSSGGLAVPSRGMSLASSPFGNPSSSGDTFRGGAGSSRTSRHSEDELVGGHGSTPGMQPVYPENDGDDVSWRTLAERLSTTTFADAAQTNRIGTFYCSDDTEAANARLSQVQARHIRPHRESDSSVASLRHASRSRSNSLRDGSSRQSSGAKRYQSGTGQRRVAPTTISSHASSPLAVGSAAPENGFESLPMPSADEASITRRTPGTTDGISPHPNGNSERPSKARDAVAQNDAAPSNGSPRAGSEANNTRRRSQSQNSNGDKSDEEKHRARRLIKEEVKKEIAKHPKCADPRTLFNNLFRLCWVFMDIANVPVGDETAFRAETAVHAARQYAFAEANVVS
eukprot:m.805451 g.805451  ORF g.805451 m.805451 type:complete len:1291 (-) comp23372_c0_seq1:143-4015(-)